MDNGFKRHLVLPDFQIKPGVDISFCEWIGKYIVDKKPDVIIHLGDFADMHSLSSYDVGRKAGEGARYNADIEAAWDAMELLEKPITEYNRQRAANKKKQYVPQKVITLGNHENRINRHVNSYPVLEGALSTDHLPYKAFGWDVYDFLVPVELDGIRYCHFFPRAANGRVLQTVRGAANAKIQVTREMMSCTAGHMQGLDWHPQPAGGTIKYGLIAGSCYLHEESTPSASSAYNSLK